MKIKIGILICDELHIYYYDKSNEDATQKRITITFTEDNIDGIKFIECFSKELFDGKKILKFMDAVSSFYVHIDEIKEKINTVDFVKKAIVEALKHDYTETEILKSFEEIEGESVSKLSKAKALDIFKQKGVFIGKVCTYVSLNRNGDGYTATIPIKYLAENWYIILNDSKNKKLYLFCVPQNSAKAQSLKIKNEQGTVLELNINYNDLTFAERTTKYSFAQWLKLKISY